MSTPDAVPESRLSLDFDEQGNLVDPMTEAVPPVADTTDSGLDIESDFNLDDPVSPLEGVANQQAQENVENSPDFVADPVAEAEAPSPVRDQEISEASPPSGEQQTSEQTPIDENQEQLRQQFEQARRLGQDFYAESRRRENRDLSPYLNQRRFNPEDVKALQNREQISVEDIAEAERASLAVSLQAADQVARVELPRQRAERALKRRTLEDEVDSLKKVDGMLGAGFRRTQSMIKEGRATEVVQEARKVIAYSKKTAPDKIKASDKQVLEWVQNTIHSAGRRVRKHRTNAIELLRGGRR